MPIKIGKSKSSSGSELMHTNSCPDESSNQTRKNRGIRQFFNRSKCNSKIPTGRSSASDESTNNNKGYRTLGKAIDNMSSQRLESSPVNLQTLTCHSVSPKLYTNSCASSIEELSKVALNTNVNCTIPPSVVPCSPIQDVIFEEDYEDALLLNNRTGPSYKTDNEQVSKDNIQLQTNNSKRINHGIYNEPNDSVQGSNKEIIEACRICQITPTNLFKEIRSRSGGDTDPSLVHPDIVVGGRCSTNSSSVGSAQTLSDSPAVVSSSYSPQIHIDSHTSPNSVNPSTNSTAPSINTLSISIQTSVQSSSGPPTAYSNSPKGNTSICHHPSSPFAPPSTSKPISSSNPSTTVSTMANTSPSLSPMFSDFSDCKHLDCNKAPAVAPNIISRRPGKFGKPVAVESPYSSGTQSTDGNSSDVVQPQKNSERRSEYYSKHPVYEEAWDLKLKRLCLDIAERSSQSSIKKDTDNQPVISAVLPTHAINAISFNRPQSAVGSRRRTDSPSSKYSSPPAVPPHRRRSAHIKMTHCNSLEDSRPFNEHPQASQSILDSQDPGSLNEDSCSQRSSQRSHLKHNINPSFDDQGITADYDYAYNETWSLGVQLNMAINLSNNSTDPLIPARQDSVTLNGGYMDKIDSVDSEESSSLSTSQEAASQNIESQVCDNISGLNLDEENANVDNDSLSNDSYEEPWDVRHGRVISELTSARLIDPACVLSAHEQPQLTKNVTTDAQNNQQRMHRYHEQILNNSSRQNGGRINGDAAGCPSVSASFINKTIILDEQPWYHVNCSRSQAEQLLAGAAEGSFLVRKSETSKNDYSLTIRHENEFLHMKISRNSRGFILGQYSQPYSTIPQMLHHYSLTMVPVRGADTVMLKNPIIR